MGEHEGRRVAEHFPVAEQVQVQRPGGPLRAPLAAGQPFNAVTLAKQPVGVEACFEEHHLIQVRGLGEATERSGFDGVRFRPKYRVRKCRQLAATKRQKGGPVPEIAPERHEGMLARGHG